MSRVCPSGHQLSINVVLPPGAGRDYCPTCGWTDADNAENALAMVDLQRQNVSRTEQKDQGPGDKD
jgi:hypothetical protein